MKRNQDIRDDIRKADIFIWEVAEVIGISDVTMSKRLRRELTVKQKSQIREAIEIIKSSRR